MTRTRSSSWTASEAQFTLANENLLPPCIRPRWSLYADDATHATERQSPLTLINVCTWIFLPLLYYLPHLESSTRLVLVFFFLSPPSTLFLPGRVSSRTLGLSVVYWLYFFVMREVRSCCIHHYPRPRRRFSMSNALYLDETCTHLTPQGYLYPFTRHIFGYPGTTDTYDSCILFFNPIPSLHVLSFT